MRRTLTLSIGALLMLAAPLALEVSAEPPANHVCHITEIIDSANKIGVVVPAPTLEVVEAHLAHGDIEWGDGVPGTLCGVVES